MKKTNNPQVWENVWDKISLQKAEEYLLKEEKSIQWKRIKKEVLKRYGSFKGLKIIELGGGTGVYSLLFSREGSKATVLDYSSQALELSKKIFKSQKLKASFLNMNALKLKKFVLNKYDISMSFGTAEHFIGKKRISFIKSHFDVLKKEGMTFICVPNKYNLLYRIWKFLSETFGRFQFGLEVPFSREEFKSIGKKLGVNFYFLGGYLFETHFLFKERIKRLFCIKSKTEYPWQIGTPLDEYMGKTIIGVGTKN